MVRILADERMGYAIDAFEPLEQTILCTGVPGHPLMPK